MPTLSPCPLHPHAHSIPMSIPSPCPLYSHAHSIPMPIPSPCPLYPHAHSIPMSILSPCPLYPHAHSIPMPTLSPCPFHPHAHSIPMPTPSPCPLYPHAHSIPMPTLSPCPLYPHAQPYSFQLPSHESLDIIRNQSYGDVVFVQRNTLRARRPTTAACQACRALETKELKKCAVMEKYFVFSRLEQSKQNKSLLHRHDKPNQPTKKGLFSFVLFESPFASVSVVSRGHPSLFSLVLLATVIYM
jgi:hypothetical protein